MSESKESKAAAPPFRVAVLLSGRGSNFQALLTAARDRDQAVEIVGVISDRPNASGLEIARSAKIPTVVVERQPNALTIAQFNAALASEAQKWKPDLIVLAGFMRVLTSEFVNVFRGRIINIHPSLLPAFKGLHAHKQTLDAGVRFSGCTVHIASDEVDSGAIIAQAVVPVFPDDTEESLAARILRQEHRLLPAVVRAIALKEIELQLQPDASVKVIFKTKTALSEESVLSSAE